MKQASSIKPLMRLSLPVITVPGLLLLSLSCGKTRPSDLNYNTDLARSSAPTPSSQPTPLPVITNDESPAGQLEQAKIYLKGQVNDYDLSEARKRLALIPRTAPEYKEAQQLLAQIKIKEKSLKTTSQTLNQSLTPEENAIRENLLAADQTITYEQLTKSADRYQGRTWAFRGTIVQIQESGGQTSALVALDVLHDKIMKVQANLTTDFVEKDQIYVVGFLAGNYSYISQAGWNITVPLINASAILKPGDATRLKAGKGIMNP